MSSQPGQITDGATRRIEVFRPGTFTPMQGTPITMTAEDLRAIAAGYDFANAPTPLVVGHPRTEDQAWGWVTAFAYDEERQRLVADCGEIPVAFAEAVQRGSYKRISLSLFTPTAPNNPKPGHWYPKHVGFLGAAAPAVSGLAPVQFAGADGTATFEFGDPAFRDIAGMFRKIREWFIAERGLEEADRIVSPWEVSWLERQADDEPFPLPAFAAPSSPPPPNPEPPVSTTDADRRSADLDRREAEVNRRAAEQAHTDNLAFAEGLIAEGKLLPASGERVVALLDSLSSTVSAEVSFSEGDQDRKLPAAAVVREILSAQPKVVSFGEMPDARGGSAPGPVDFAAPDNRGVDKAGLEQLAKVREYQSKHPNTSFADAVAATSRG